jgi:hypothetical protein
MSLIKKLLNNTTLSNDICNLIAYKIYKSNYYNCINEYFIKLYGKNYRTKQYSCEECEVIIGTYDKVNIIVKKTNNDLEIYKTCDSCFIVEDKIGSYITSEIEDIDFDRDVKNRKLFGIKLSFGIRIGSELVIVIYQDLNIEN